MAGNVQCNILAISRKYFCRGKAISITYSGCGSVTLGIQYAVFIRRIILSSVDCPAVEYFVNIVRFVEELIEHKMCVLIFPTKTVRKISHSKNN